MSVKVIAFFNNKGGVGKTSLVYHIAWMFADQGMRVVAADLDAQGNLSAAFLDEERLEQLWPTNQGDETICGAITPLLRGLGDVKSPHMEQINENLALIPGDIELSRLEDALSVEWPRCMDGDERAFRVISAFWRAMHMAADVRRANVVVVDLGPNLGAVNRSALIASDFIVMPLRADPFTLQGLRNLGLTLHQWRTDWKEWIPKNPNSQLRLPSGEMKPIGYIIMQLSMMRGRSVRSHDKWVGRIPTAYREYILDESPANAAPANSDEHCLGLLKDYRSLMPMAQEARKPIFHLKPADGALGAHTYAVSQAHDDFLALAREIASRAGVEFP